MSVEASLASNFLIYVTVLKKKKISFLLQQSTNFYFNKVGVEKTLTKMFPSLTGLPAGKVRSQGSGEHCASFSS